MLYGRSFSEVVISAQADGVANTAGTAASAIPASAKFTLPANVLSIGSVIKIEACGKMSSVITTPGTMRFDVRFGAILVFDSLAVLLDTAAGHTNVGWLLEIMLTCRAIGATTSANFMGHGRLTCEAIKGQGTAMPVGGVVANLPWNSTPAVGTGFDSTISNVVDLFFTQTVATGSMTLQQYALTLLN
jgi:hypothetical protein